MTTYEALNLVIGASQCALIWYGLNQMRDASNNRDKALDDQRTALDALIERTAASSKSLEATLERTAGNSKSLDALIESTAASSKSLEATLERTAGNSKSLEAMLERTAASSKSLEATLERTADNSKSLENQSKALEELIKGQEESRMAFRAFIERMR